MHTVRLSISLVEITGLVLEDRCSVNEKHTVSSAVGAETCVIFVYLRHNVNVLNGAVISGSNRGHTYDDHIALGANFLDKVNKSVG